MKTKFLCSVLVLSAFIFSCKKKDTTPDPNTGGGGTPAPTYVISKDSTYDGTANNTQVRIFEYNSNKKLVKVKQKYGTMAAFNNWDTIIYNNSGQVAKVESYTSGLSAAQKTCTYTFTGGYLANVVEAGKNDSGAYVRTRNFTYVSGKLSAVSLTYTTGKDDKNGGPSNMTAIVFNGNNISSADLTGYGVVTITSDLTAANPYYGLYFDSEDFINLFNQNNILKAYLAATPTQIFVDNTYTYADGRVATVVDASQSPARTTVITYKSL